VVNTISTYLPRTINNIAILAVVPAPLLLRPIGRAV